MEKWIDGRVNGFTKGKRELTDSWVGGSNKD